MVRNGFASSLHNRLCSIFLEAHSAIYTSNLYKFQHFWKEKTYFDGFNSNKHVKSFTMIGIMWGLECNQGWYKAGTKLTYQVKH